VVVARARRGGGAAPHRRAESEAAFQRGSRKSPMPRRRAGRARRLDGWIWGGFGISGERRPRRVRAGAGGSTTGEHI
jgi:hypothetical protein